MPPKTRQSLNFKLIEVVGLGKEFIPSEVPTLRSVISRGILLQEENDHNDLKRHLYPLSILSEELAELVVNQWKKSNSKFREPVVIKKSSTSRKIKQKWENLVAVANGRCSAAVRKRRLEELDKIFDIVCCKHEIFLCGDEKSNCTGCNIGAHISCSCAKDSKIPKIELLWLHSQRNKIGERSSFQISQPDMKESEKQNKAEKRKIDDKITEDTRKRKLLKVSSPPVELTFSEESPCASEENTCADSPFESEFSENLNISGNKQKNYLKLENTAATSIRYGVSSRATAAIASAYLKDLIQGGHIDRNLDYLATDGKKIYRAQQEYMESSKQKHHMKCADGWIKGLYFDGKTDKTLVSDRHMKRI